MLSGQSKNGRRKMVYLFVGQDNFAKDAALKRIKEEFLPSKLVDFNLDILHGDKLSLGALQEKLLFLPVKSSKRIILLRNAQDLDKRQEGFILQWSSKENKNVLLILDISREDQKPQLIKGLDRYAKIMRFKEDVSFSTFNLSRQIECRRISQALLILNELIKVGERPERILGGLRYSLESNSADSLSLRRRIKLLLNCDIEIKTGRCKPVFALEKLVVNLCALA